MRIGFDFQAATWNFEDFLSNTIGNRNSNSKQQYFSKYEQFKEKTKVFFSAINMFKNVYFNLILIPNTFHVVRI